VSASLLHPAVYLGRLVDAGVPQVDGAGLLRYHRQDITVLIPIHRHTMPSRTWKVGNNEG